MHRVLVDGGGGVCEQNELGTNYTCSSILSQIQAHEVSGLARNSGKECPNLKSIFQNKSLISGEKKSTFASKNSSHYHNTVNDFFVKLSTCKLYVT